MFHKNQIVFSNYNDLNLNFDENLNKKDSILIKNSKNIKLNISSKINKIIIENSSNIILFLPSTISGIDIEKSFNITIVPIKPFDLKLIQCFKSVVLIKINKKHHTKLKEGEYFKVISENSSVLIHDELV